MIKLNEVAIRCSLVLALAFGGFAWFAVSVCHVRIF